MRLPNRNDLMLLIACLLLFVVLTWVFCGCTPDTRSTSHSDHEDDLVQAPFDAQRYAPPEWWGECKDVWEVADTRTNQRWFVLRMNNEPITASWFSESYVVLPIEPTGDMG